MSGLPEKTNFAELAKGITSDFSERYGSIVGRWAQMLDEKFKERGGRLTLKERELIERERKLEEDANEKKRKYEEDLDAMIARENRFEDFVRNEEDRLYAIRKEYEGKEKSLIVKRDALSQKDAKLKVLEAELSKREEMLIKKEDEFAEREGVFKKKTSDFTDAVKKWKTEKENLAREYEDKLEKFKAAQKNWMAEKEKTLKEFEARSNELDEREGTLNLEEEEVRQAMAELKIREEELARKGEMAEEMQKKTVSTPLGKWVPLLDYVKFQGVDALATDADRLTMNKLGKVGKSLQKAGLILHIRFCGRTAPEGVRVSVAFPGETGEYHLVTKGEGGTTMEALKTIPDKLIEWIKDGHMTSRRLGLDDSSSA